MSNTPSNNKRIAKNTLVLYVRMLFLMAIGLYTSRVVLQALGVEDFGIYNVVGGFVALFAVLSQSLSSAASRFLTFELGRGDRENLARVFSSTLLIHIVLALLIAIVGEVIGMWYVNTVMVVPPERMTATNWVFHFSVLAFCLNLVTVPHNAAVIAHERMSAFAYISIFEGVGKLLICFLIMASSCDRLVFYAVLMFFVQLACRGMLYYYCRRHFPECRLRLTYNKALLKEISGFAGWNIIGTSAAILRNQGVNVLLNLFFGPVVNAARALANQVMQAVNGFAENFFMALRPQITKSYASGNREYMMTLITQGSRLSFYMLFVVCLPILLNTDYLLHLWLKTVPAHTTLFVQLTLLFTMVEAISMPLLTAQQATGNIRNYQIIVGGLQIMNLPLSYVILKMGGTAESVMFVAISLSALCLIVKLFLLRESIQLDVWFFVRKVLLNIVVVSLVAAIVPCLLRGDGSKTFLSFAAFTLLCLVCSVLAILYVGLKKAERQFVFSKVKETRNKFHL